MKNLNNIILALAAGTLLTLSACKKDKDPDVNNPGTPYACATCVTSPEAKSEHDASSKGIYKGILIASTGTIKFNVANDGTTINAIMVIDGTTVNLSSSITWTAGAPYVAPFTGLLDGNAVSITFSVQADGSSATITSSTIPGHPNASFTLVKETSNALIEGFEGTYSLSNGEKGTFNILLSEALKRWGGVAREDGTTDDDEINGTLDGNKLVESDNGKTVGTRSGDEISGSFQDGEGKTVTVQGRRTL